MNWIWMVSSLSKPWKICLFHPHLLQIQILTLNPTEKPGSSTSLPKPPPLPRSFWTPLSAPPPLASLSESSISIQMSLPSPQKKSILISTLNPSLYRLASPKACLTFFPFFFNLTVEIEPHLPPMMRTTIALQISGSSLKYAFGGSISGVLASAGTGLELWLTKCCGCASGMLLNSSAGRFALSKNFQGLAFPWITYDLPGNNLSYESSCFYYWNLVHPFASRTTSDKGEEFEQKRQIEP